MIKMSSYPTSNDRTHSSTVAVLPSMDESYWMYGPFDVDCSFADLPDPELSKSLTQWNAHNRFDVGYVFASQCQRKYPWHVRLKGWLP